MYEPEAKYYRAVIVLATDTNTGEPRWTSGHTTGNVRTSSESHEIVTDSPLVEEEKEYYHKEDIKNPDNVDSINELNRDSILPDKLI